MNSLILTETQILNLLKMLNPNADIRGIDTNFNNGENILFSVVPKEKLILPYGCHITKDGITNKWDDDTYDDIYITYKIYSQKRAILMGKKLEQKVNNKKELPKIKKIYMLEDKIKKALICYEHGYKIVEYKDFWDILIELEKQDHKKINIKEFLRNDNRFMKNVPPVIINKIIKGIIPYDIDDYLLMNNTYVNLRPNARNILKNNYAVVKSSTLMGKKRAKNTDSSIILSHFQNKDLKLIAVADSNEDDYNITASTLVIEELKEWFNKLNLSELEDESIVTKLQEKIYNINCILYNIGYRNNIVSSFTSSLTVALILKNNTIISSIGNTKAYRIKEEILTPIFKPSYKPSETIIKKDNQIIENSKLGKYAPYQLYTANIENTSYDKLILVTDGVCYSLNDKTIEFIANTAKKEELAEKLVDMSIGDYNDKSNYGEDNATALVYIKK